MRLKRGAIDLEIEELRKASNLSPARIGCAMRRTRQRLTMTDIPRVGTGIMAHKMPADDGQI